MEVPWKPALPSGTGVPGATGARPRKDLLRKSESLMALLWALWWGQKPEGRRSGVLGVRALR